MNVKAADLMAADVVAVQRRYTVKDARNMMLRHGSNALPVVHPDGTVAGTVSSKDLAADLKGGMPVSSVVTREVYTIPRYNDIHHAARLMRNHGIHHIGVTQEQEVVRVLSSFPLPKLVEQHRFDMKPGLLKEAGPGASSRPLRGLGAPDNVQLLLKRSVRSMSRRNIVRPSLGATR